MEQLAMFQTFSHFDEKLANWEKSYDGDYKSLVLALVPEEITGGSWKLLMHNDEEWHKHHDVWAEYVYAIQQADYFNLGWTDAMDLLESHRDSQRPIKMEVWTAFDFRPVRVIEYL